ncbi:MAG: glycosyltransferase [Verrucomicrobiales bacterium]|nr:glycosyltransferase [Verrucomicrobiales bacterium]
MKPKLLFVSNLFPDAMEPYRGLDNATVLHALRESCDIQVISPRPWLPGRWTSKSCRSGDEWMQPIYVKAPYLPKIGGLANDRLMAAALRPPLKKLRNQAPWDWVMTSWLFPDGAAVGRCLGAGERQVLIAQGSDVHAYLGSAQRRKKILSALQDARGCITRSASLARQLEQAGADPKRLYPIVNGIDTAHFYSGGEVEARQTLRVPEGATVLLWVGNFLTVKDPLKMLRTFAALRERLPNRDLLLVMIGQGPLWEIADAEVASTDLKEAVHLTGPLPAVEVARWMRAAHALCMTSQNEGLPNVILEAQACGLPVIATDVGGIAEVIDAPWKGALAARDDEAQWVARAVRILTEITPEDRQRIAAIGSARTWDSAAAAYRAVLEGGA